MNRRKGKIDYKELKKIAKSTKNNELLADVKKRSNNKTVDKWQE